MKTIKFVLIAILSLVISASAKAATTHRSNAVAKSETAVLKIGSRGTRVVLLQDFLEVRGFEHFYNGVRKGFYGTITAQAVREFQHAAHLPQTGIADQATLQAMKNSTCKAEKPSVRKFVTKAALKAFTPHPRVVGVLVGKATTFGHHDRKDNGRGSALLNPNGCSYTNTRDPQLLGVALPKCTLKKYLGVNGKKYSEWLEARQAGVQVEMNGVVSPVVHILDVGPGSSAMSRGVIVDRLFGLARITGQDGPCKVVIYQDYFACR